MEVFLPSSSILRIQAWKVMAILGKRFLSYLSYKHLQRQTCGRFTSDVMGERNEGTFGRRCQQWCKFRPHPNLLLL